MFKLTDFRLTDEEIDAAITTVVFEPHVPVPLPASWAWRYNRAVADAATAKAMRLMVEWLRAFESTRTQLEDFIAIGRGHGLDMAADELEERMKERNALY